MFKGRQYLKLPAASIADDETMENAQHNYEGDIIDQCQINDGKEMPPPASR